MNCKFVWLIVLSMLMATASAANLNYNGGSVASCTLSGSTYTCSTIALGSNDIAVIASGYTVVVSDNFSPSYNQGLSMSGSAVLQTVSGKSIDLSSSNNLNVSGGTITAASNFKLGASAQSITANVNAATITTAGASTSITGTVNASGAISFGSKTTINGSVSAASISTDSSTTITGALSVTGKADLGSAFKINGSITANEVKTGSPATIGGAINASTVVDLGSGTTVNGKISGSKITTDSPVTLNGSVTASVSFALASGSKVVGDISAPTVTLSPSSSTVSGNISSSGALDIGSGNTVNGNVNSGSLTLRASSATINGSVKISGDVDMGSGTVINGDLTARNVTTNSSNAIINGNAAVNAIYIDWNNSVTKTITCTGPGAVGCSCVTKADPNYKPTCGAAAGGVPHHFQISHSGTALTCQPQTVTVTACANANCTAPHYTSNVDVKLTPGGQTFTISGGTNSLASVQSKTAGTFTLTAESSGVTNATTCINSGTGAACDMVFKDTGLVVSGTNHISMASGALVTIQALTSSPGLPSCVPLVTNKTVDIDVACSYKNPVSGTKNVVIGSKSALCGGTSNFGTATAMPFTFDANGKATAVLQYADVGRVGLSATYTTSSLSATGNGEFIAAPAQILLTARNAAGLTYGPATLTSMPTSVFAKASEVFTLTATAVSSSNNTPVPNFGKEITPSKVRVSPTINKWDDKPAAVAAPVPAGSGTAGGLTYAFPAFNGGSASANANFDNVGYLKLSAALDDGVTNTNAYYLGEPLSSFQTTGTQYVARFIPDHFDTVLVPNTAIDSTLVNLRTMACPSSVTTNPCTGGTDFTHSAQNFLIQVKAYNGATPPALATNYAGALAKVIDLSAMTSNGGATVSGSGTLGWSLRKTPAASATRFTFTAGVGSLGTADDNYLPVFTLTTNPPLPATIYLRATENSGDGVSSLRTTASQSVEAPLSVVKGRLLVTNGYGSPSAQLPVNVNAQYYMPSGYVFNALAEAVGRGAVSSYIKFTNCQKALDAGGGSCIAAVKLANTSTGLTVSKGLASFKLAAPMITGIGTVNLQLINSSNVDLIPFLPSTIGKEAFGIYSSGPVIYTREIY